MRECVGNGAAFSSGPLRGLTSSIGRSRFQLVEHLPRGVLTETDTRQQILLTAQTVLVGDAVVVGRGEPAEGQLKLARLALQQLFADLDGAFTLVLVQPVLDLVACP